MKRSIFGILITAASAFLLAFLGIRGIFPASGGSSGTWGEDYYENGDFKGLYMVREEIPAASPEEAMAAAVSLGLADGGEPDAGLTEKYIADLGGLTAYRFTQTWKDLPVYGREVSVLADGEGRAVTGSGNYLNVGNPDTCPALTESQAEAAALSWAEKNWKSGGTDFQLDPESPLVIYATEEGQGKLAYQGTLSGKSLVKLLIDAGTGEVLLSASLDACAASASPSLDQTGFSASMDHYEGHSKTVEYTYSLDYDPQTREYVYQDTGRNLYLLENAGQHRVSEIDAEIDTRAPEALTQEEIDLAAGGEWPAEQKGNAAYVYASMTYDFFHDVLGRQGYNGNNDPMYLVYNCTADDGKDNENAWGTIRPAAAGSELGRIAFGHRVSVTPNLVGHEYTHAVSMSICGTYSLVDVMECYSDVFGELIESWYAREDPDWVMSAFHRQLSKPLFDWKRQQAYNYHSWLKPAGAHAQSTIGSNALCRTWRSWREAGYTQSACVSDMAVLLYRSLFLLDSQANYGSFTYSVLNTGIVMTLLTGELDEEQFSFLIDALKDAGLPVEETNLAVSPETVELVSYSRFLVRDAVTEEPIQGARVHYYYEEADGARTDHRFAVTDEEGFCQIDGLRQNSRARITVEAAGYEDYSSSAGHLLTNAYWEDKTTVTCGISLYPENADRAEEITEVEDTSDLLLNILEDVAAAYSVIPAETEEYGSLDENPYYAGGENRVPSQRITGLLLADVWDYDGDGQEELLTVRLDSGSYALGRNGSYVETEFYLSVYDQFENPGETVPRVEKADEISFSFPGFPNDLPDCSVQFARGESGGIPSLYIDYFFNMNTQSYGVIRLTYDGSLHVSGGTECSEFAYSAVCNTDASEEALETLGGSTTENRPGWTPGEWYSWEGAGSPPADFLEAYREDYRKGLFSIGLTDSSSRSLYSADSEEDDYLRYINDCCRMRPAEHLMELGGKPLTELGGILSYTVFSAEDAVRILTLTTYDSCGYLDAYRQAD